MAICLDVCSLNASVLFGEFYIFPCSYGISAHFAYIYYLYYLRSEKVIETKESPWAANLRSSIWCDTKERQKHIQDFRNIVIPIPQLLLYATDSKKSIKC